MSTYLSTRGEITDKTFTEVLLAGTAEDGGLFVPEVWPALDQDILENVPGMTYAQVAFHVLKPFVGNTIPEGDFSALLEKAYSADNFDHAAIAPLVQIGPNAWILELFHGPTLSFKDYALQLLGKLFDYELERQGKRITIIGATSGDTGSAAISACKDCKNIDIFILHPEGRTSDIQRKQMTTVDADNVHNIAVQGTFDDCQAIVKTLFGDKELNDDVHLSSINSINWARIMAQTVYYTTTAMSLTGLKRNISFSVPTGNFGNVFAGWVARTMGVPIEDLIVSTNRNDILTRFFESGKMQVGNVEPSISPSMDIQVSSNFERYLCELCSRDHKAVVALMNSFAKNGKFNLSERLRQTALRNFTAYRCTDEQTLQTIKMAYDYTGELIDPHTAVALYAAMDKMEKNPSTPTVVMACAHAAKFPEAVVQATGKKPEVPAQLDDVLTKKERFTVIENSADKVKDFVRQNAKK